MECHPERDGPAAPLSGLAHRSRTKRINPRRFRSKAPFSGGSTSYCWRMAQLKPPSFDDLSEAFPIRIVPLADDGQFGS